MTYSDKLKDPRWQKKRLEVLERDEWTCQMCGDKDATLHVHHFGYHKSGNPWDTEAEGLITFCEDCHAITEFNKNEKFFPFKVCKIYLKSGRRMIAVRYLEADSNISVDIYTYNPKLNELKLKSSFYDSVFYEIITTLYQTENSIPDGE